MTRILGIDPGSLVTGWGVVEVDGPRITHLASGVVATSAGAELPVRLRTIHDGVRAVCLTHQPDEVVVERVFLHRNADSALKLGQARGAAICATFATPAPLIEYSAKEIKQAVTGTGAASKTQVEHMVRTLLGLREALAADQADALAAALCHAHARSLARKLAVLGAAARRPRTALRGRR